MAKMVEVNCKSCGHIFLARVADVKRGWGKFCSKSCKAVKQEQKTHQYRTHLEYKNQDYCDHDWESNGWDSHKD